MSTGEHVPETAPARKRWWPVQNARSAFLTGFTALSTIALVLSNIDGIMRFVRAHTPGGVLSQFPFTMQISSSFGAGLQPRPFYREKHIQEGTLIRPYRSNNEFGLPALDFRVVNNSPESTFVRELIFKVAHSKPDKRPILVWRKRLNFAKGDKELILENEGWGEAIDSKIENVIGTFAAKGKDKTTTAPFVLPLGNIHTKSREISLTSLLNEHFKVEKLSDSDRAKLAGSLTYSYVDANGEKKPGATPFSVTLLNAETEPEAPAEGPEKTDYESVQILEIDRESYSVSCRADVNLKPHEAYRFVVSLCSRQSATHDFDVIMVLSNGAKINLGHYRLEFYLPRSMAPALAQFTASKASPLVASVDEAQDVPAMGDEEDGADDFDKEPVTVASVNEDPDSPAAGPVEKTKSTGYDEPTIAAEEPMESPDISEKPKAVKATYPYGIPVPGHPEIVESPFLSGKYVDVTGFDHNALVQDPYVRQFFLVP
jgi:hypothetical protein